MMASQMMREIDIRRRGMSHALGESTGVMVPHSTCCGQYFLGIFFGIFLVEISSVVFEVLGWFSKRVFEVGFWSPG
jgi:hypothetical protein